MVSGEARLTGELIYTPEAMPPVLGREAQPRKVQETLPERQAFPLTIAAKPPILLNS